MKNTELEEIDIFQWPTFPSPWISQDAGEVFVLDDYLLVFQKKPLAIREHMEKLKYGTCYHPTGMFYLYAMPIFYKICQENMFRPVMAITLEQSDQTELLSITRDEEFKKAILANNCLSPVMFCMFNNDCHSNFGVYFGKLDQETVKDLFFRKAYEVLGTESKLEKIGTIGEVLERVRVD